jgi:hypothetical protein
VSDHLTDSAPVARAYCPGCEPDADPIGEILDVRWCELHAPARDGAEDTTVNADSFLSGSAEAGGDANRRWCEFIHAADRRRARSSRSTP